MIPIKSKTELAKIRKASLIVAKTLNHLEKEIKPGITTQELDQAAAEIIKENNAKAAFLGYHGYPANICASVNEEVVHGIPSGRVLRQGDIISIDVGVEQEGYFGDAAITVPVGDIDREIKKLIQVTQQALLKGIAQAKPGNYLSDISWAVQSYVEAENFSVVRDFVGHGIGANLHEEPQIPNYGQPGNGVKLQAGMVLAIEPMVNMGSWRVKVLEDGWTAVTKDNKHSAHFEHTIAITDKQAEILTIDN